MTKCKNGKDVMLNLFQHLIRSINYETLNQIQGDKTAIVGLHGKPGAHSQKPL